MLMIGWTGEAVAASLTIVLGKILTSIESWKMHAVYQTSRLWPVTRLAGLKGSCRIDVDDMTRQVVALSKPDFVLLNRFLYIGF